jgi:Spy/CpxP family protein refolding chaperone
MSSNVKPWLLLVGIFIVGVVTGWALTFGLGPRFAQPPGPHDVRQHLRDRLIHDLNLTTDQQTKIQPILNDAETKIRALHREEIGRGAQIMKETDDQISAFLTPDQKVQLQKLEAERDKMFSGHMRHRDGPDGAMPPPPPPEESQGGAPTNAASPVSPK